MKCAHFTCHSCPDPTTDIIEDALKYRLDKFAVDRRAEESVELVDLRAEVVRLKERLERTEAYLSARLLEYWTAYIEVAEALGYVSTDDTGRIGAVAPPETLIDCIKKLERKQNDENDALRELLRWYVENDDTNEGGKWEDYNAGWLEKKRAAMWLLGMNMEK